MINFISIVNNVNVFVVGVNFDDVIMDGVRIGVDVDVGRVKAHTPLIPSRLESSTIEKGEENSICR